MLQKKRIKLFFNKKSLAKIKILFEYIFELDFRRSEVLLKLESVLYYCARLMSFS